MTAQGRKVTVKRIAIATRWGMAVTDQADAHLPVKDPLDEGEPIEPHEKDALFIGMLRLHIANLIRPLDHAELAGALYRREHTYRLVPFKYHTAMNQEGRLLARVSASSNTLGGICVIKRWFPAARAVGGAHIGRPRNLNGAASWKFAVASPEKVRDC